MDGASSQAGWVFTGEQVHSDVNVRSCGKTQPCAQAPAGRKSVLIHQLGGSLVLRPWGQKRSSLGGLLAWIPLLRDI